MITPQASIYDLETARMAVRQNVLRRAEVGRKVLRVLSTVLMIGTLSSVLSAIHFHPLILLCTTAAGLAGLFACHFQFKKIDKWEKRENRK